MTTADTICPICGMELDEDDLEIHMEDCEAALLDDLAAEDEADQ